MVKVDWALDILIVLGPFWQGQSINHTPNSACWLLERLPVLVYRPVRAGGAVHTRGHWMYGLSCWDGELLRDKRVTSNKVLPDAKSK